VRCLILRIPHHAIVGVAMLKVARRILMGTYALSVGYYDAYYKRA
jgi:hypothetical protein